MQNTFLEPHDHGNIIQVDQHATPQDPDAVTEPLRRRKTSGSYQDRLSPAFFFQDQVHELHFCLFAKITLRFIEQKHLRIMKKYTGDRQLLFLFLIQITDLF